MAVIRDATGAGATTTGAACTASHTIVTPSLSTVVFAFVAISVSTSSTSTTCTATYGGTAMTQLNLTLLGSGTSRSAYAIFYLFNPTKGAQNCVVTPGGTATKTGVRVATVSYNGVNSVGTAQTAAALTISATSVANGYNIFGHINGVTMTSPSQSQRVLLGSSVSGVGDFLLVQDAAGTGSNITFSVGGTATTPGTFGVALSPTPKAATVTDTMDTAGSGVGLVGNWQLATTDATISGGRMRYTPSTPDVLSYGTIGAGGTHPQASVDLTDSTFACEVVQIVDGSGTVVNAFLAQLDFSQDNEVLFAINPGANGCYCAWYSGGVYQGFVTGSSTFTYNPTVHKYFRFRETSGTLYWEYSTDWSTWVTAASMATPFSMRGVHPWWECYYATGTTVTVPAFIIDNVNVPPPAKAATIVETFVTKDTTKWTWKGTANVANGYATIPCTATYDGIITNSVLDLTGSSWSAQVVQRHSGTGGSEDLIGMLLSNADINNYEAWLIQGTSLIARERVANVDSQTSTTFDPAVHQYLMVRESGGTVFWDYSTDGVHFTNFRSLTAGLTLSSMYGAALSGIYGTDATPGTLHVDNVNTLTPKAASFVETFATSTAWTLRGTAAVTGGQLVITTATTGLNDAYTNNAQGHLDLESSSIMFNVVGMVAATDGCLIYLSDSSQTNTFAFYKYIDGNLYSCERVASVDSNTNPVPYDPVAHKYWRIRESGGTVYWETSPTGVGSWTVQRSKAWAVPSINSFFIFPTTTTGSGGLPFVIEDINVTPAPAASLTPPTRRPNYGSLLQL